MIRQIVAATYLIWNAFWRRGYAQFVSWEETYAHKVALLVLEIIPISLQCCNEVGEQLLRPAQLRMQFQHMFDVAALHLLTGTPCGL